MNLFARKCVLAAVAIVVSLAHLGKAEDEVELRALIKLLERRLADAGEAAPRKKPDERVTEIGATAPRQPVPQEAEKLVVRIYDLSDLFTIAPPYIARQVSDLRSSPLHVLAATAPRQAMFPTPGDPTSTGGMMGGGFGGGLGSGLGGFFRDSTGGGEGGADNSGGVFQVPTAKAGKRLPPGALPQVGGFGLVPSVQGDFGGARISFDDLTDAIVSTIEPESWEEVGGEGSIEPLGNALIVRAKPNIHEQIDNLLQLLRKKWGTLRTISVEVWWLWMREPVANNLLTAGRPAAGEHTKVFGAVDNGTFIAHLKEIPKDEKARSGYRATVTCYNGQTVHTVAGGQQLYVTDIVPVVDGKSVGYRPVVSMVQEGAALQVRPHATRKGKYAALDIHTRVNLLADRPNDKPKPAADVAKLNEPEADPLKPQIAAEAIDRPRVKNARLSTSLRMPFNQVMLVGAMSFEGDPQPGNENLYLFVKLAMQELRDDLPEEAGGEGIK